MHTHTHIIHTQTHTHIHIFSLTYFWVMSLIFPEKSWLSIPSHTHTLSLFLFQAHILSLSLSYNTFVQQNTNTLSQSQMVSLYSLSLSLSQISHSVSRPAFTKFSTILVPLTYYTHRRVSMLYNSYISIHEGGYISTTNLRPFDEFEPGQICTKETMSILQVQRHSLSTLSQRKQRLMESWQKGFYSIITHDPL